MWHYTKGVFRKWMEKLLHIHDSPERTSAAFAMGVFLGFSPLIGLHTVIGMILAFSLKLNRVAVLVGLYALLPWFQAPYYAAVTALGALLTGTHLPVDLLPRLQEIWHLPTWKERWADVTVIARPLLLPFFLGGTLVCTVLGSLAYPLSLGFIRAQRRLLHHSPAQRPPDKP